MKFKPADFDEILDSKYIEEVGEDSITEKLAEIVNNKLEEDAKYKHRLSQWPIIRERYRQVLTKMRRQSSRIKELEVKLIDLQEEYDSLTEKYSNACNQLSSDTY
jgi:acyl carrier protein phosphodiesterase